MYLANRNTKTGICRIKTPITPLPILSPTFKHCYQFFLTILLLFNTATLMISKHLSTI